MSGRRQFIAALGVAPLVPIALAQTPPVASPAPMPSPSPAGDAAVEALTGLVERRWGAFLDAKQMTEVRSAIEWNQKSAAELRRVKLANADEPATVFEARPAHPRSRRR